jgi:two-component system LytT family sensor kinase
VLISTELNFLRSQVNPHFLFNVMNTIYFQIDKGNIQARASVEKLSEMLRYQLYECISDKIEIGKELEYIKNYVAMQSLRMEKGTDIKLCIDDNLSGFFIAPLLLLPIIENAFKHISNFKNPEENKIHISLQNENEREFSVQVTNTFDKSINTKHLLNSGGLGMQNLKRRLEAL